MVTVCSCVYEGIAHVDEASERDYSAVFSAAVICSSVIPALMHVYKTKGTIQFFDSLCISSALTFGSVSVLLLSASSSDSLRLKSNTRASSSEICTPLGLAIFQSATSGDCSNAAAQASMKRTGLAVKTGFAGPDSGSMLVHAIIPHAMELQDAAAVDEACHLCRDNADFVNVVKHEALTCSMTSGTSGSGSS